MPYGSDAAFLDYLALSGRTLPATMTPAVARYWGSMYVNSFERRYKGSAISLPDSFPRDIYNPVPVPVEYAAYEAGLAYAEGVALFGSGGTSSGQVVRERIDVIEIQYAGPSDKSAGYYEDNLFIWPLAYQYLVPYMKVGSFFASAIVVGSNPSVRGNGWCR